MSHGHKYQRGERNTSAYQHFMQQMQSTLLQMQWALKELRK